jgi:hypothetical protein
MVPSVTAPSESAAAKRCAGCAQAPTRRPIGVDGVDPGDPDRRLRKET